MDSWDDERLGQYTDRLFMDLENENRTQSRSITGPAQFVTTPAPRTQCYNQPRTIHAHHQRAPRMELLKTEICRNWKQNGVCDYGVDCHYAHGNHEILPRKRISKFNTKECPNAFPKRHLPPHLQGSNGPRNLHSEDSNAQQLNEYGECIFAARCNYAHPGEHIRCLFSTRNTLEYWDAEYLEMIRTYFGPEITCPFGIYV